MRWRHVRQLDSDVARRNRFAGHERVDACSQLAGWNIEQVMARIDHGNHRYVLQCGDCRAALMPEARSIATGIPSSEIG